MQQILSSFLLTKKFCPLPGLGSLQYVNEAATYVAGENRIIAPQGSIRLLNEALPRQELLNFIASEKKISHWQADTDLEAFCSELKNLSGFNEIELPHSGKFLIDAEGYLSFKEQNIYANYFPDVEAYRVIHPNEQHQILVGDRETTNTVMSEFYTTDESKAKPKWWIAALVFFAIGAAVIAYYYTTQHGNNAAGNGRSIQPQQSSDTYTIPK